MRTIRRNLIFGAMALLTATVSGLGTAQQVTGTLGEPSVTTISAKRVTAQ